MRGASRKPQSPQPAPGDVVVTKVGDRYHIGQMHADRIVITPIAMRSKRTDALVLACRFVTQRQRVFLCKHGGSPHYVEIDCLNESDKVR